MAPVSKTSLLLGGMLLASQGQACDLTKKYFSGHKAHFEHDLELARALLQKLKSFETNCQSLEGRIAENGGKSAAGRSCEGLREVKKLYQEIDSCPLLNC